MEKYWLRINNLTGYNHHKIFKKVFTCLVLTEFKQIVFVIFHSISRSKLYMHCVLDLTWKSKKVLQLVFCQINLGSGLRWSVLNANLTIFQLRCVYEADFIQGLLKKNQKNLARSFNFTFRYIDDVL